MKTTVTFSVEIDTLTNFLGTVDENKDNKNEVIEYFMNKYIETNQDKTKVCDICGASYVKDLTECPQCKIINNRSFEGRRKNEMLDGLRQRLEMMERLLSDGTERSATKISADKLRDQIKILEEEIEKERGG